MTALLDKFNDGGPFFTYPIVMIMFVIIALIIKGFLNSKSNGKTIALIKSLAWFALAWGFLGRTFGLIVAFDNVAASGELTPRLLADGLKMAILNPLFGFIVFLIARAGVIFMLWFKKREAFEDNGNLKPETV